MTEHATGAIAPERTTNNEGTVTEYGIVWDEPVPGLPDVSGPYAEHAARRGLERSAFDGKIATRTVTYTPWKVED